MRISPSDSEQIFLAVSELTEEECENRLQELTDDPQVRGRVRELLASHRQAGLSGWLESPPLSEMAAGYEETHSLEIDSTRPRPVLPEAAIPKSIDRYEIRKILGRGSFATVYQAYDPSFKSDVALKVSHRKMTSHDDREAFLREAQHLFELHHKNIVRVYNADFTDEGQAYIAMEFVKGINLQKHLATQTEVPIEEIVRLLVPIAEALAVAHKSTVHRDLKPANILIGKDGVPKIADFGLAIRDDRPNRRGEYAGTPAYMAPEQVRAESDNLHGSADRWALGVILYEMLTGRRPFLGNKEEIHQGILHKTPKPPREIRPEIPHSLESLCLKCLEKAPSDRPSSAHDIAVLLRHQGKPSPWWRTRWWFLAPVPVVALTVFLMLRWSAVPDVPALTASITNGGMPPNIQQLAWSNGCEIKAGRHSLDLDCRAGLGFLLFGETPLTTYELEYAFEQEPVIRGGFEIVLGYREPEYHKLHVHPGGNGDLMISHHVGSTLGGGFIALGSPVRIPDVDDLSKIRIRIYVANNSLKVLSVNDKPLLDIAKYFLPARTTFRGAFGLRLDRRQVRLEHVMLQRNKITFVDK